MKQNTVVSVVTESYNSRQNMAYRGKNSSGRTGVGRESFWKRGHLKQILKDEKISIAHVSLVESVTEGG